MNDNKMQTIKTHIYPSKAYIDGKLSSISGHEENYHIRPQTYIILRSIRDRKNRHIIYNAFSTHIMHIYENNFLKH